eukprot:g9148.t1
MDWSSGRKMHQQHQVMELRPGPYDRPNGESRRGAETWRSCHLKCLLDALRRDEEHPRAAGVETSFGESVLELELRPIPKATFFLQGVLELRLSCSPQLVEIPPNLGRSTDLESLCLISNSLTSLPSEDANCLEELPHFTAQLRLFTAPGNHLTEVAFWPQLERLEVHGSLGSITGGPREELRSAILLGGIVGCWHSTSQLVTLKVMGNQLTELPEEVGHMPVLRILGVASNRLEAKGTAQVWEEPIEAVALTVLGALRDRAIARARQLHQAEEFQQVAEDEKMGMGWRGMGRFETQLVPRRLRSLPHALAESRELEWLLAYENQLEELPPFGPRNWRLTRLLLESNPLRPVAVQSLVSYIKTLGLDSNQVAVPELPDPLPAAVSVGTVIPINHAFARSTDRAESDHPELLIVAFAASQERTPSNSTDPFGSRPWGGEALLPQILPGLRGGGRLRRSDGQALDSLHSGGFDRSTAGGQTDWAKRRGETPALPLGDFDVLTVVDHRMRWYAEDRGALQQVLKTLRPKYQKMMCVGASMGGFGALLHGGLVADAVVAFNPQATLTEALLRPPAETPQELEDLSNAVMESVRVALARKAQMIVHCAADEHLMHFFTAVPDGVQYAGGGNPSHPRWGADGLAEITEQAFFHAAAVGSSSIWCEGRGNRNTEQSRY